MINIINENEKYMNCSNEENDDEEEVEESSI